MRPYESLGSIDVVGMRKRIWPERDLEYDEAGAFMTPHAVNLRITAGPKNSGIVTFGGKKVVGAQDATWQGFPYLAPGHAFCWDFGSQDVTVDVRFFWYDGTKVLDTICFSWLGEPVPERVP